MAQSSFPRALVALGLFTFLLTGCDETPPPIVFDAGPDSGPRDSGPRPDTGPPRDSGPSDASDGSTLPTGDAGAPTCVADPERVYKLGSDPTGGDRIVGLAAGATSFAVVWTQFPSSGGISEVHGERLSSSGARGVVQRITTRSGAKRSPTIAAVGTSWVVAWVDNDSGTFELRTLGVASDLSPGGTVHDLTATAAQAEDNPIFLNASAGLMLAWVEDDMTALTRVARAQRVGTDGAPSGTPGTASSTGQRPGQLAFGELEGGPALVWSEGIGGTATVYLQGITSAGAVRGSRVQVSTEANADGTVDAALLPTGGAVVFGALVDGIRHEIRFREVPPDGMVSALQAEQILAQGAGASIARFAGGYAISYRAPATTDTPEQIRLMLVQSNGDPVADIPVIEAPAEGGRTTVRVSGDGQIAITWADSTPGGTDVRVAIVTCGAMP